MRPSDDTKHPNRSRDGETFWTCETCGQPRNSRNPCPDDCPPKKPDAVEELRNLSDFYDHLGGSFGGHSPSNKHEGLSLAKKLAAIADRIEAERAEHERQESKLIDERDHAEEILGELCAHFFPEREWSNHYTFDDFLREIQEAEYVRRPTRTRIRQAVLEGRLTNSNDEWVYVHVKKVVDELEATLFPPTEGGEA